MKIGIMTFHYALNAGAVLQAYALQTFLEKMGHEVEFIDYRQKRKRNIRDFLGKGITKTLHKCIDVFNAIKYNSDKKYRRVIKIGKTRFYSLSKLKSDPPEYDVYIAGSDQIWNIGSKNYIDRQYYLEFGNKETIRISYAASFGQGDIPVRFESEIKELLLQLDYISIRETNGVNFATKILKGEKKVYHLCDPTFLLDSKEYIQLFSVKKIVNNNSYIVSYILNKLDEVHLNSIDYLVKKTNKQLINVRNADSCIRISNHKNLVVDPYQWLYHIYHADLVICCSFHAVVFSLIFHKKFIVICPYHNQRIYSLLESINLTANYLTKYTYAEIDILTNISINWESIDRFIAQEREKSYNFMSESFQIKKQSIK